VQARSKESNENQAFMGWPLLRLKRATLFTIVVAQPLQCSVGGRSVALVMLCMVPQGSSHLFFLVPFILLQSINQSKIFNLAKIAISHY